MKKKAIAKNAIINGTYYLAINSAPSLLAETVGYCINGEELEFLEKQGEWSKVSGLDRRGEAVEGWVRSKYLE